MQAPTRKARRNTEGASSHNLGNMRHSQSRVVSGKFYVLASIENELVDKLVVSSPADEDTIQMVVEKETAFDGQLGGSKSRSKNEQVVNVDEHAASRNDCRMVLRGSSSGAHGVALDEGGLAGKGVVASKDEVVHSLVTLNLSNHAAVRVLERGSELALKAVVAQNQKVGVGVPTSKLGVDRKGTQSQKNQAPRPH
ncbi:hypothetical protein V6N13_126525 [Hibiscus sabdariffa]|uniref:Uncharacterized protein n=2 Tax=Hibiscus sabdariffa TaxID=183260 RepID=A0ABR1ZHX0_9ROSI